MMVRAAAPALLGVDVKVSGLPRLATYQKPWKTLSISAMKNKDEKYNIRYLGTYMYLPTNRSTTSIDVCLFA